MRKYRELPSRQDLSRMFTYDPNTGIVTRLANKRGIPMKGTGCKFHNGYVQFGIGRYMFGAHRIAWKLYYGVEPTGQIDHINGNPSDNRLANLRLADGYGNNRNKGLTKRNTSGVKGVCWETSRRKWRATVGTGPNGILVGRFDHLETAKIAVMAARERLHGAFANHG